MGVNMVSSFHSQSALKEMALSCAKRITDAKDGVEYFDEPFKHIVIDNFFPEELADICLTNFPGLDQPGWERADDTDIEVKYRTTWKSEFDIPDGIADAVKILNSSIM